MRRPRPFYFLRRAVVNLWGAPLPAAVTAATIAIVIFLFGAFLLTGENTYRALVGWAGEGDPLVVYAKRGLPPARAQALAHRIELLPDVSRVKITLPEEGLSELRRVLGTDADVLEGIEAGTVLPAAISVGLRGSTLEDGSVELLASRLRHFEDVEAVDSEIVWLERFAKIGRVLAWVGFGWAAILGFGALLVIGNSTRLAALTRKDEIEVLRLVGASESFIIVPFFLEGALQGLAGSLAGVGMLAIVFFGLRASLAGDPFLGALLGGLRFLEPTVACGLLAAGPLLGAVGSVGSVRRFLRGIEL
jgi:cell division transport system permease protein